MAKSIPNDGPGPEFIRDSACTACPLHKSCRTVCLPTTPYRVAHAGVPKTRAVLILGEAPGAEEDRQGEPFVGRSGQFLRNAYVDHWNLWERADIFFGNAVRCRPLGNETPSKSQIKACRPFLLSDLRELEAHYDEVLVLCVGAVAASAMGHKSLKRAFAHQLSEYTLEMPPPRPEPQHCKECGTDLKTGEGILHLGGTCWVYCSECAFRLGLTCKHGRVTEDCPDCTYEAEQEQPPCHHCKSTKYTPGGGYCDCCGGGW